MFVLLPFINRPHTSSSSALDSTHRTEFTSTNSPRPPCMRFRHATNAALQAYADTALQCCEVLIVQIALTTVRRSCTSELHFGTSSCSTHREGSTTIALLSSMLTRWRLSRRRGHFGCRTRWGPHQCVNLRTFAPAPSRHHPLQ
jgi:hypothetical protein